MSSVCCSIAVALAVSLLAGGCNKSANNQSGPLSLSSKFLLTNDPSHVQVPTSSSGKAASRGISRDDLAVFGSPSDDFGLVAPGSTKAITAYAVNFSSTDVNIVAMSFGGPDAADLSAGAQTYPLKVAAGTSVSFTVTFSPSSAKILQNDYLEVDSDDNSYFRLVLHGSSQTGSGDLLVYGGSSPNFFLMPNQFECGSGVMSVATAGASAPNLCGQFVDWSTPIHLVNDGGADLNLISISFSGDSSSYFIAEGVTPPSVIPAGGSLDFRVDVVPATPSGMYQVQMTVGTNDPDPAKQQYEVTLFRWVAPAEPCLTATFSSPLLVNSGGSGGGGPGLAFLRVPQSTAIPISVSLTNAGNAATKLNPGDLTLSDTTDYQASFNASALTLAPGDTQTFTITLQPQTTNPEARTDLRILGSDVGASSGTVLLATIDAQVLPSAIPFVLQGPGYMSLSGGTITLAPAYSAQQVQLEIGSLYGLPATVSNITVQGGTGFPAASISGIKTPLALTQQGSLFTLNVGAFSGHAATATLTVSTEEWGSFTFPISAP
jgi:hypothetical protein